MTIILCWTVAVVVVVAVVVEKLMTNNKNIIQFFFVRNRLFQEATTALFIYFVEIR